MVPADTLRTPVKTVSASSRWNALKIMVLSPRQDLAAYPPISAFDCGGTQQDCLSPRYCYDTTSFLKPPMTPCLSRRDCQCAPYHWMMLVSPAPLGARTNSPGVKSAPLYTVTPMYLVLAA